MPGRAVYRDWANGVAPNPPVNQIAPQPLYDVKSNYPSWIDLNASSPWSRIGTKVRSTPSLIDFDLDFIGNSVVAACREQVRRQRVPMR
jgi:hypothetical protein